tara:strand:+ start:71 stop:742 length:672 start_codon:yes stop_codon:yes gene_type:complete
MEDEDFQGAAEQENLLSLKEIRESGPIQTCAGFGKRLENGASTALSQSGEVLACSNGCWFCCYYKVDARPEEVFRIQSHLKKTRSSMELLALRKEIDANAKVLRKMTYHEQLYANLKCPFLVAGSCSIYEVRPEKCQTFHAKDVDGCRSTYEHPEVEVPNSFSPAVFATNQVRSEGRERALAELGYDPTAYELNIALSLAFSDPKYRKKYDRKKKAFPRTNRG